MRIVFAGTPEYAVPSLRALFESPHEVVGVITREDAPLGRKRLLTPSPVAAVADELGLQVFKSNRLDETATAWVEGLGADLGVIVAYGGLVREPLLSLPGLGWINLHFSDLPRWRGAAPVQRSLMAGEQQLGVTVFRLVEQLDAGDVLTRDELSVVPGTTAGEALSALSAHGTLALTNAIETLAASPAAGEPQTGEPSYAHKLTREDGKLDLSQTADKILAQWAGVTPEPGAFVFAGDQIVKILQLAKFGASDAMSSAVPGTAVLVDGRAILALEDACLELQKVQPAGKPAMAAADWLRGRGQEAVLS